MILIVLLVVAGDFAAIEGLLQENPWGHVWSNLWISFLSLAPCLYGAYQGLGWVAFESAWAEHAPFGAAASAERLRGNYPFGLSGPATALSLLRLVSGACLFFGLLTLFLRIGLERHWLDEYPKLVLYLIFVWFRVAPLGLLGPVWAAILSVVSGGRGFGHTFLASVASGVGWFILWDLFGGGSDEFWQVMLFFLAYFPTYGFALCWGGAVWWLPSRLGGGRPPGTDALPV